MYYYYYYHFFNPIMLKKYIYILFYCFHIEALLLLLLLILDWSILNLRPARASMMTSVAVCQQADDRRQQGFFFFIHVFVLGLKCWKCLQAKAAVSQRHRWTDSLSHFRTGVSERVCVCVLGEGSPPPSLIKSCCFCCSFRRSRCEQSCKGQQSQCFKKGNFTQSHTHTHAAPAANNLCTQTGNKFILTLLELKNIAVVPK